MEAHWLVLVFRLPAAPSRDRVSVWRRLRKMGALYFEAGCWMLPKTPTHIKMLREVQAEIERHGGVAVTLAGESLGDPEVLQARFDDARQAEYKELLKESQKFLDHIEREKVKQRYEFIEVEEMEEDLAKLDRWLEQVRQRDVFSAPSRTPLPFRSLKRMPGASARCVSPISSSHGSLDVVVCLQPAGTMAVTVPPFGDPNKPSLSVRSNVSAGSVAE